MPFSSLYKIENEKEYDMIKKAITSVEVNDLISNRWSPRSFKESKFLTKEQITQLLEAARWAASSMNEQPWRFVVWNRNENPENFQKVFDCLSEGNQKWCKNVNTFILAAAYTKYSNGDTNTSAQFDTGLAVGNMLIQAVSMGLATHPMGGYDKQKIKEIFNLSDDLIQYAIIAIGYQAEAEQLEDPIFIKREKANRLRKELGEIMIKI